MDRVALVEGALRAEVQHSATATEVVGVPLTDALARTLGMQLSILTGMVTRAEWAPLAARWPEVLWMLVPDVVDWYGVEILPKGGDHELQHAGSVLVHIRWGTSQQRCTDKLNCDPYHVRTSSTRLSAPRAPWWPYTGYGSGSP